MRKFLFGVVTCFLLAVITGCGTDRSQVLKVYNWFNYIDMEVIPEFEQWYFEQTGEHVKVEYTTFETNQEFTEAVEIRHEDYDVVSPSDYIIERMLANEELLPIDKDFGSTPCYIDSTHISPFIYNHFSKISSIVDANDYAVGNMWGTTGVLYNAQYVTDNDSNTWNVIRNYKYKDRILIKDSARDVYSQVILAVKEKEIAAGTVTPEELMYYTGEENLALVEQFLINVHENVLSWDAVEDKDKMVREEGYVNLTWNGEAVQAIEEAAKKGVKLRFSLPDEGFTLWFDGWVIPKYAVNTKAARYWINFMNRPDVVIRNTDVTRYVACSGDKAILEHYRDNRFPAHDLSYFFGPEADSVHINPVMFPDRSEIERSVIERDWGENTQKLLDMWARVTKREAGFPWLWVLGGLAVAGCGVAVFRRKKE